MAIGIKSIFKGIGTTLKIGLPAAFTAAVLGGINEYTGGKFKDNAHWLVDVATDTAVDGIFTVSDKTYGGLTHLVK